MSDVLAEREATIARLRGALAEVVAADQDGCGREHETTALCGLCANREMAALEGAIAALATPDTGRRWLEAVEQAKGALRLAVAPTPDGESWAAFLVRREQAAREALAALDALR